MTMTIEHEGRTVTLNDPDIVVIDDVVRLVRDALLAVGFHENTVANGFYAVAEEIGGGLGGA